MVQLLPFIAVTVPLVLMPGASTAVVLRNALAGGTRAGVVTAVGINAGSFCYGLLTAFGFAVALRRWPSAWTAVHVAGVAYLTWLGVQAIRRAILPSPPTPMADPAGAPRDAWSALYQGLLTNLLNPAIATFYLVLLPQFIPSGYPIVRGALILTAVHIALAASWHLVWAAAGGTLARVLASGRPRRIIEAVAGVALIAFAVKIAIG